MHLEIGEQSVTAELLGATVIREIASKLDIVPTKKLGQNFVIDPNTVRYIVDQSHITEADIVLEVGPGLGSLTLGLLAKANKVVAIEIDSRLAQELPHTVQRFAPDLTDRLTVIEADALKITPDQLGGVEPTAIVANLPYNIAVPVTIHLLEVFPSVTNVLVMVQKEVADRICAGPGSRTYGIPSVKIKWFGRAESAGNIGKNVFWPAPNVDSGLVRITVQPQVGNRAKVFSIVDACFAHRRKTLRAGLSEYAGSPTLAEVALRNAGIDPSDRAERLDLSHFMALSETLSKHSE
jgi:16S rRNA (adenine1518-N6/adenine1519-N6)-dimethyltransferase